MCENPKTIFVHNQKAAGMSIDEYMFERLPGSKLFLERHAYTEDGISKLGKEAWGEYFLLVSCAILGHAWCPGTP